jgi:hypothetical protein
MNDQLEELITSSLRTRLDGVEPGPGDLAGVTQRGSRTRIARRATVAVLAVVTLGGGVALWAADDGDRSAQPVAVSGTWTEGAESPLSPRWMSVAAWTGEEALFLGGGTGSPCPPNASCTEPDEMASDGAAYNPDTDTWRAIAPAPVPIGYWFRPIVVGDQLVLLDQQRFLAYDIKHDTWRQLPSAPTKVVDQGDLTAVGGEVYVLGRPHVLLALDPAAGTWREVTDTPGRESAVVATREGIFVSGPEPGVPNDGDTPAYTVVQRWDGSSWYAFPTTGQIGTSWHWTGQRLVDLDPQTAPGLDGDPPYGGVLDPATGVWSPLPNAPDLESDSLGDGWSVNAADGPLILGWRSAYDDRTEEWTSLGKPDGTSIDSDQAGVLADGQLLVFGGLDSETGYVDVDGLSNQLWIWTP